MKTLKTFGAGAALAAATLSAPAQAYEGYIGEIFEFGGNFCPRNTMPTDGRLLPISSNNALFAVLGTRYGGDGRTLFGLPTIAAQDDKGAPVTTCIVVQGIFPSRS